jgi:dolichol-phosphate mannosyltransferase
MTSLTAILPSFNEAENLRPVVTELIEVARPLFAEIKVLIVDDGSTDDTPRVVRELCEEMPVVGYVRLRRNLGKSQALKAGLERADSDLVLLIDADGQDDPAAIPDLLAALDAGHDLATGRRAARRDRFVKRITSRLYNWVTSKVTGVEGRDFNSGLKLMRREVAASTDLYGELHRYIPVLVAWAGYSVVEVDVHHRPRHAGKTKFGRARFWRGLLDLITVKFLTTYDQRPFHLIGGLAFIFGGVGGGLLVWMLVVKITGHGIGDRPALLFGILLVLVAAQLASVGLLAELVLHSARHRPWDAVRETAGSAPARAVHVVDDAASAG